MRVDLDYRPLAPDGAEVHYLHGPDSSPRAGVRPGVTTELRFDESGVYPGTSRRVWVHVPARCESGSPAHLAVFQDRRRRTLVAQR